MVDSQLSSPLIPALFTTTSMPPKVSTQKSKVSWKLWADVTSVRRKTTRSEPYLAANSLTVASPSFKDVLD